MYQLRYYGSEDECKTHKIEDPGLNPVWATRFPTVLFQTLDYSYLYISGYQQPNIDQKPYNTPHSLQTHYKVMPRDL